MSHPQHYYIGEGSEAAKLITETMDRQRQTNEARKTVQEEYKADGLLSSRSRDGGVAGLCFNEKQTLPFLKGEIRLEDGYGYFPKLNCKAGKELRTKLTAPEMTFSASDHIIQALGVARMVAGAHSGSRTGLALYQSVAGIVDGKLLVKIPGSAEEDSHGDKMPQVPSWLREVKESEWLAAQGG